jgi:hypothetical protein
MMSRFGDYFVLFNAPPGTYELSHGEYFDDMYYFTAETVRQSATELSSDQFVFMGDYTLKVKRETMSTKEETGPMILPYSREEIRFSEYYFDTPVKRNDEVSRKDFILFIADRIRGTVWESVIR